MIRDAMRMRHHRFSTIPVSAIHSIAVIVVHGKVDKVINNSGRYWKTI